MTEYSELPILVEYEDQGRQLLVAIFQALVGIEKFKQKLTPDNIGKHIVLFNSMVSSESSVDEYTDQQVIEAVQTLVAVGLLTMQESGSLKVIEMTEKGRVIGDKVLEKLINPNEENMKRNSNSEVF
jgi:hypothetical protein